MLKPCFPVPTAPLNLKQAAMVTFDHCRNQYPGLNPLVTKEVNKLAKLTTQ